MGEEVDLTYEVELLGELTLQMMMGLQFVQKGGLHGEQGEYEAV